MARLKRFMMLLGVLSAAVVVWADWVMGGFGAKVTECSTPSTAWRWVPFLGAAKMEKFHRCLEEEQERLTGERLYTSLVVSLLLALLVVALWATIRWVRVRGITGAVSSPRPTEVIVGASSDPASPPLEHFRYQLKDANIVLSESFENAGDNVADASLPVSRTVDLQLNLTLAVDDIDIDTGDLLLSSEQLLLLRKESLAAARRYSRLEDMKAAAAEAVTRNIKAWVEVPCSREKILGGPPSDNHPQCQSPEWQGHQGPLQVFDGLVTLGDKLLRYAKKKFIREGGEDV